ncbi:MAG: hypothetical protein L6R42_007967, partial [Xanthoria sp. 1 TBL-2021]
VGSDTIDMGDETVDVGEEATVWSEVCLEIIDPFVEVCYLRGDTIRQAILIRICAMRHGRQAVRAAWSVVSSMMTGRPQPAMVGNLVDVGTKVLETIIQIIEISVMLFHLAIYTFETLNHSGNDRPEGGSCPASQPRAVGVDFGSTTAENWIGACRIIRRVNSSLGGVEMILGE